MSIGEFMCKSKFMNPTVTPCNANADQTGRRETTNSINLDTVKSWFWRFH